MTATRRRTVGQAAIAVALAATALGLAPTSAARADTAPSVKVTTQGSGDGSGITVGGPATDVRIDVVPPPSGSTVLRVVLDNAYSWEPGILDLKVTDAGGAVLPIVPGPQPHSDEVDIANPAAGATHLLVSAVGPMAVGFEVSAQLVDNGSHQVLAADPGGPQTHLTVYDPTPTVAGYCEPGNPWVSWSGRPVSLDAGGYPVRCQVIVGNRQPAAMGDLRPTLTFSAVQLRAVGYTARQLATLLSVSTGPYASQAQIQHRQWTVLPDGSLSLDMPALTSTADPFNGQLEFRLTADYRMRSVLLQGEIGVTETATGASLAAAPITVKVTGVTAHDFNGDGKADLLLQDAHGYIWMITGTGNPKSLLGRGYRADGFFLPVRDALTIPNIKHTANVAFGEMDAPGQLAAFGMYQNHAPSQYEIVKGDYRAYNLMTGSADLAGGAYGGYGDLLARDGAGHLWLYPGIDDPSYNVFFGSRIQVPGNWSWITAMVAPGDLTGDGKPDLLVRARNGALWLFPGTGNPKAPFGKPINLGGDWNWAVNFVACGDLTGDGRPDLLVRSRAGNAWLYPGTGDAKSPFGRGLLAATGWSRAITVF